VALANGDGVALELDGQPTGNPILNPANGWHTLVAYKTAAPQFRHTLRFRTQRLSIPPDAYEDDDTRETFRALFGGAPQQHNFSEPMDNDWVAFAVAPGTRSRVTLSGAVAARAALTLYRQDEYPAGPITQVASASGTANQLEVVDDSPFGFPFVVYYAWSRPTSSSTHGPGTEHTLSVTVEVPPDAFEPDNEQSAYTALYEGQPQNHNFHEAGDEDWVAYAVGPGVVSRVTLEGAAATGAEITMYRHLNYPDGPVEQVSSSSNAAGTILSVEHPSPPGEPIAVYYVRARPTLPTALRSNFVLAVTVD
jgi:hypothetical protein